MEEELWKWEGGSGNRGDVDDDEKRRGGVWFGGLTVSIERGFGYYMRGERGNKREKKTEE